MMHSHKMEEYDEDQVREYKEDEITYREEIRRKNREFLAKYAFDNMLFKGLENNQLTKIAKEQDNA